MIFERPSVAGVAGAPARTEEEDATMIGQGGTAGAEARLTFERDKIEDQADGRDGPVTRVEDGDARVDPAVSRKAVKRMLTGTERRNRKERKPLWRKIMRMKFLKTSQEWLTSTHIRFGEP